MRHPSLTLTLTVFVLFLCIFKAIPILVEHCTASAPITRILTITQDHDPYAIKCCLCCLLKPSPRINNWEQCFLTPVAVLWVITFLETGQHTLLKPFFFYLEHNHDHNKFHSVQVITAASKLVPSSVLCLLTDVCYICFAFSTLSQEENCKHSVFFFFLYGFIYFNMHKTVSVWC